MKDILFKWNILRYYLSFRMLRFRRRAQLENRQKKRLKKFEEFLKKNSPYYAEKLARYGSIEHLPPIGKSEYMAHFSRVNTLGIQKEKALEIALRAEENRDFSPTLGAITVGLSSGTTGNRGIFLVSPAERAQWVAAVLYKVVGLEFRRRKVAFFLRSGSKLYESVRSSILAFQFYDLSRPFEALLEDLNEQSPHILVAQPAVLVKIAEAMESGRIRLRPERVISVAEVLEPDVRKRLERSFGIPVREVYQCTEGFLASSCPEGFLHFHEEFMRIDLQPADDSGRRFYPVISDFTRRSQPIIRYVLNDIVHIAPGFCPCGNPALRIDRIEGRQDDMILFHREQTGAPVLVFPDFMRRIFLTCAAADNIEAWQLVQTREDLLEIFIQTGETTGAFAALEEELNEFCRKNGLVMPQVMFYDKIPYSPMEKFRRVKRAAPAPENASYL